MTVLNRAMILGTAFLLTADDRYVECVAEQMDYILGVNAAGYSYVTGVGEHSFRNPHNRVTVADGIEETIPGFVSGGPNAYPVDEKAEWLIDEMLSGYLGMLFAQRDNHLLEFTGYFRLRIFRYGACKIR